MFPLETHNTALAHASVWADSTCVSLDHARHGIHRASTLPHFSPNTCSPPSSLCAHSCVAPANYLPNIIWRVRYMPQLFLSFSWLPRCQFAPVWHYYFMFASRVAVVLHLRRVMCPSAPHPLEPRNNHPPDLVALPGPTLTTMAIMAPTTGTMEVCVWPL